MSERNIPPHVRGLKEGTLRRVLRMQPSDALRPGTLIRYGTAGVYYRADGGHHVASGRTVLPEEQTPEQWRPLSLTAEEAAELV
jgi:hypothetical protein